METLYELLNASKGVSAWKVIATKKQSCELFYVGKAVETTRATDLVDYEVTIYIDKDGMRGESKFAVAPYMGKEEIAKLIESNIFAASFALNPYFELPKEEAFAEKNSFSNLKDRPFSEIIADIGEAIMAGNHLENGSLSATEIFLYRNDVEIRNSNGVKVYRTGYECRIETIPNYVKGSEEVEVYIPLSFECFDAKDLTRKIEEALTLCKDRAEAVPMPFHGSLPVVLDEEEGIDLFFYEFVGDLSYSSAYTQSNLFEIGQDLQNGEGDKLTLDLKPDVPGALGSRAFDEDGVVLSPCRLIDRGVVKARHGSYQYGYYLKEKRPTGRIPVMVVEKGTMNAQELKKAPYLRCVRFSGMQADLKNNFFGGEVRLGYYFDGEKEIPVTGFSIQGDYLAALKSMRFADEIMTNEHYQGPKYLYIPDVKVH